MISRAWDKSTGQPAGGAAEEVSPVRTSGPGEQELWSYKRALRGSESVNEQLGNTPDL